MSRIDSVAALRELYAAPKDRTLQKELRHLDKHSLAFLALSPFVVVSTSGASGALDASPRGGEPGFVKALDDHTLLLPDAPGNNRLDTLENIVATGQAGLLFMIAGVDETLRVNGAASLSVDAGELDRCTDARRRPKLVIRVEVEAVYLHCAKALMRSHLWSAGSRIDRGRLPTMGQMIAEQIGATAPVESEAAMRERYAADL